MNMKLISQLFFPLGFLCIFGPKLLSMGVDINIPKNIFITLNLVGFILVILSLIFKKDPNKQ